MIDLGVTGVNGKGTRSKNQGTDLRSDDFYGSVGSMSGTGTLPTGSGKIRVGCTGMVD